MREIWTGKDYVLYAEDQEGHVGIVPPNWISGCIDCGYGEDIMEDLMKDSLQKAWNWYCDNLLWGRCVECRDNI